MWVKVDYSTEAKKNPRPNMGGEWAIYTKKHWWNKWVERETYADVGWCIRDAKKLVEYPKQGERAIAWLEKQGEQKFEMKTAEESLGVDSETYNKIVDECIYGDNKVESKFKVGEWVVYDHRVYQVVELSKEGYINLCLRRNGKIEFAPSPYCEHWTLEDAKDGDVLAFDNDTIVIFKDLYNSTTFHSYCHIEDGLFDVSKDDMPDWWEGKGFHPATKEQRDLLFQKMKEAGYEWDSEKKELKKVNSYCQENCKGFQETGKCFTDEDCKAKKEAEQKLVESEDEKIKKSLIHLVHLYYDGEFEMIDANTSVEKAIAWLEKQGKPSDEEMKILLRTEYEKGRADAITEIQKEWSEEDERMLHTIIADFKGFIRDNTSTLESHFNECIDWLKSLRPQNRWKPSDEQITWLYRAADDASKDSRMKQVLNNLLSDLKKLKEEKV